MLMDFPSSFLLSGGGECPFVLDLAPAGYQVGYPGLLQKQKKNNKMSETTPLQEFLTFEREV